MKTNNIEDLPLNDLLTIIKSKFETEKNSKNKAYAFILSRELLDEFRLFTEEELSNDPFKDCKTILSLSLEK